jgi:hypothetical protein
MLKVLLFIYVLLYVLPISLSSLPITEYNSLNVTCVLPCSEHGNCTIDITTNETYCACDRGYMDDDCSYKQKSQQQAFLYSFFLGSLYVVFEAHTNLFVDRCFFSKFGDFIRSCKRDCIGDYHTQCTIQHVTLMIVNN